MISQQPSPLLQVRDLETCFPSKDDRLLMAVDGVDLTVNSGEIVGLVGESGSGKTVLAHSILGLVPAPGHVARGKILWRGEDTLAFSGKLLREFRGRSVAMIFQNPQSSLNPVYTVGRQLTAVIRLHKPVGMDKASAEAVRLLELVGIPDAACRLDAFPHQLSGGLCQRVMIAMALACEPSLLIADEPTSSLDVTIQAQVVKLLLEIRDRFGMAILFIAHDLGVVAELCDRVAVMYRGRIVEEGPAEDVYASPKHPYTRLLLDSVPIPDPRCRRTSRPGHTASSRISEPSAATSHQDTGCRFRDRCPDAIVVCATTDPRLTTPASLPAHRAACVLATEAEAAAISLRN